MQEHEREQPLHLRRHLGLRQRHQQSTQADRLRAKVRTQPGPTRRGIPLGEDEIDDVQDGVEPVVQDGLVGHAVRNARLADLAFRPHQTLRHRRFGHEEGARNRVRLQAAQRSQRQANLRFDGERWMATGEDQPEAIVRDLAGLQLARIDHAVPGRRSNGLQLGCVAGASSQAVDCLVACRLDDPRARMRGHPGLGPLGDRGRKRLLRDVFGQIEVAQHTDQCGNDPAPVGPVQRFDQRVRHRSHRRKIFGGCRSASDPFDIPTEVETRHE